MLKKLIGFTVAGFIGLLAWNTEFTSAHTSTSGSPGSYSGSPADGNKTCAPDVMGGRPPPKRE